MSTTHGVLVGGAYPNHYISLDGQDKEKIVTLLEEYHAGKHAATLADEVNECVLTYQCVARGIRGCTEKMSKNFSSLILMKLCDHLGIWFISMCFKFGLKVPN